MLSCCQCLAPKLTLPAPAAVAIGDSPAAPSPAGFNPGPSVLQHRSLLKAPASNAAAPAGGEGWDRPNGVQHDINAKGQLLQEMFLVDGGEQVAGKPTGLHPGVLVLWFGTLHLGYSHARLNCVLALHSSSIHGSSQAVATSRTTALKINARTPQQCRQQVVRLETVPGAYQQPRKFGIRRRVRTQQT